MRLSSFRALSFDCYGTLIDWESGLWAAMQPVLARVAAKPRSEALADFARHESAQQAETPGLVYPDLLAAVHRRLAAEWGAGSTDAEDAAFGGSIPDWPAFPDSAAALAYLKQHYQLVILSNVDRGSFAASNRRLGVEFDAVYTAQDIGSYKPDPRNFTYLLAELERRGLAKDDILHTAQSLFHDHVPAQRIGMATAWIDRADAQVEGRGWGATTPPGDGVRYDFRFPTLAAMAAAHRADVVESGP